jgi:hypothetical protein
MSRDHHVTKREVQNWVRNLQGLKDRDSSGPNGRTGSFRRTAPRRVEQRSDINHGTQRGTEALGTIVFLFFLFFFLILILFFSFSFLFFSFSLSPFCSM